MRRTVQIAAGTLVALAATATPALAARKHAAAGTRHFTEVESGVQLSATGSRFEDVFRVKSGPFGGGSVIRDFTLTGNRFPVSGKDTATTYYGGGRLIANETITLGIPLTDGIGSVSGTGTCSSGTFQHQGETCTYKISGGYDLITGRMSMILRGTYTPSAAATKKK